MIPDGTVLTYEGTWPTVDIISLSELGGMVKPVTAWLAQNGFVILGESDDLGVFTAIAGASFHVRLTLQVENGLGFNRAADVISVIRHAVYITLGSFPSADAITSVSTSKAGATTAPPVSTLPPGAAAGGFGSAIGNFFSGLGEKAGIAIGLVALGIALALALIFRFGAEES